MISATFRRWRATRPRVRAASAFLAMAGLLAVAAVVGRWRADTWPARVELRGPSWAWPLAFAADGRTVLTGDRGAITSWEVGSGRGRATWALSSSGQHPAIGASSPDGKTFAAAVVAYPGPWSIDLIDAATGRPRTTLRTPRQTIMHLTFDSDGRALRATLGDCPQVPGAAAWNPGCGYDLNEVVTWDVATGRQISSRPTVAPTRDAITAISPDGRTLAIADRIPPTYAVQLWDLDADLALGSLPGPPGAGPIFGAGLGFSDDGRTLAVCRIGGTVEIWDVPTRRPLKTILAPTEDFAFGAVRLSTGGRTLALTGTRMGPKSPLVLIQDGARSAVGLRSVRLEELLALDVGTGRQLARAVDSAAPTFSPDGRTLATGEPDGSTRLRDIPGP